MDIKAILEESGIDLSDLTIEDIRAILPDGYHIIDDKTADGLRRAMIQSGKAINRTLPLIEQVRAG